MTVVVGIKTYLSLIIGELVPKTIALNNPEPIAILLSPSMKILGLALYPIVWFLSISTKLVLIIFRIKKKKEVPISEVELRLLLKQGSDQGIIEREESTIINEVIRFGDKHAGFIMTHRIHVEWIDITEPEHDILSNLKLSVHSRLPVHAGSIDKILGVAAVKDILLYYQDHHSIDWDKIVSEPLFFPE